MFNRGKGYRRGLAVLFVMLTLVAAPLAGGLALEIETLPETWEEFCALVPDMPDLEPKNVRVLFPHEKNDILFSFLCGDEEWLGACAMPNVSAFPLEFEYDAEECAFVLTEQSSNNQLNALAANAAGGVYVLFKAVDDWLISLAFHVDSDALSTIFFATEPLTRTWDNVVTESSASNFLMPIITAMHETQSGHLQIWQYATYTAVGLYDVDGNMIERTEYPVFSQFCADFMPMISLE